MSFDRMLFSFCVLVLALAVCARDLDNQVVFVNKESKMDEVTQVIPRTGLSDTYCCLKNGFGQCLQECDSSIQYYCCLKNGYGCLQLCENGREYYCCKKNGYGCAGMCPKTSLMIHGVV